MHKKLNTLWIAGVSLLLGILSGCAHHSYDKAIDVTYCTRDTLPSEVKLPSNTNIENLKHLRVAINVKIDGRNEIDQSLSRQFQALFDEVKRFEIHSLYGNNIIEMEDIQERDYRHFRMAKTDPNSVDLTIDCTIKIAKSDNVGYATIEHIYLADGNFICTDKRTMTQKFAESVCEKYGWSEAHRHESRKEKWNVGSEQTAIQTVCLRCMRKFINKFTNKYPMGGRIETARGDTFLMLNGSNEGIMANQQMTIFLMERGLPIPLAYAEATPMENGTSMLKVHRWSKEPDAQEIISELKAHPQAALDKYKNAGNDGFYAVSYGAPPPGQ